MKLKTDAATGESQFGIRPGRGSEDTIFIVRQVIEKDQEHRVPLHFNFVDSKAAFDTIWRKPLCAEVIDGQLTEWFAVQIGLR